jgi:hypothetical protein
VNARPSTPRTPAAGTAATSRTSAVRRTIYLCPWACGREGGLATGHLDEAAEAMAEADRIAAVYVGDDARESAGPREGDP